jgi:tripartite-type tricarboxylate transporter receptor subunit TctC
MKSQNYCWLRFTRRGVFAAMALCQGLASFAQSGYPDKPIKLVIGYPAGGSVDFVGRIVGDALASRLKATVVIENMGGAAGTIAAQRVAGAPADGYTFLMGSSNELAGTGAVNPKQKYDALKDFTPLGLVATAPVFFVAGPKAEVKTLADFLRVAKANPGKFSYGTSGVGSSLHFAGERLKQQAGIFMTHIPYRGVAPLTSDLVGGGIEVAMLSVPAAKGFISTGRIVALGVTSSQRLAGFPQVPALGEHPVLNGYDMNGWFAMVGPRHLPPEVTQKVQLALQMVLADPLVKAKLEEGGNLVATGKENLLEVMRSEAQQLDKLARFASMRE